MLSLNQAPLRVPLHWNLDDLVIAEVEEVSHDLSDSVEFDFAPTALLELDLDVFSSFDHLPVIKLLVDECCKIFIGQGFISLLGDLFSDDLWLGPNLFDNVRDARGGDPELLGEVLHWLATTDGSICDLQLLSGCHRSLALCLLAEHHGGSLLEGPPELLGEPTFGA